MIHPDIDRVLYDGETIARRVEDLALEITDDYRGKPPLIVGILKGSFIFMADLVRHVGLECEIDFLAVSSYGNRSMTTGAVRVLKDLDHDIEGLDILIIEDILDSGKTLSYIMNILRSSSPASVSVCALMDKPSRRQAPINAQYVGFCVPDEFLVGYGMDYAGRYRNLPYIGCLKREVYMKEAIF